MLSRTSFTLLSAAAALAVVAVSAYYLSSCTTVSCILHRDPQLKERYKPDTPLFLTEEEGLRLMNKEFSPEQEKEMKTLMSQMTRNFEHIDPRPHYKTCAIVGNSPNILHTGYGSLIDGHDAIFRMNAAPVSSFEKDVGSRTSYRLIWHPGYMIRRDAEIYIAIPYAALGRRNGRYIKALQKYLPLTSHPVPAKKELLTQLAFLSPALVKSANDDWNRMETFRGGAYPSTGVYAIVLAMHMCDKINLFGFGPSPDGRFSHYFANEAKNENERVETKKADHQEELLNLLSSRGVIHIYPGSTAKGLDSKVLAPAPSP